MGPKESPDKGPEDLQKCLNLKLFAHFRKKAAQKYLLVAQDFYSYLYMETHQQGKATHIYENAEKRVARKGLIISCYNCCYL